MTEPNKPSNDQPLSDAIRELSQIVRIVMASQEQQTNTHDRMMRRDLRWRNIRAALICVSVVGGALLYSLGLQQLFAPAKFNGPYAALVRIEGLIDAQQRANAHKISAALEAAFEDSRAKRDDAAYEPRVARAHFLQRPRLRSAALPIERQLE